MRADVYIAADVEADGPLPGPYSMLSFGLVVAGRFDGRSFVPAPREITFYRELQPISDAFDPAALEVSHLDRERLVREAGEPEQVMADADRWVRHVAKDDRPVLVAWPLAYDWLFLQWYFLRFCPDGSPFGFSSALDMKTLFWRHARTVVDAAGRDDLPPELRAEAPHTHNALDDAIEAAEIFTKLWRAGE